MPESSLVVRTAQTAELGPEELRALRRLLDAAFGDDADERFTDHDWEHALGGMHFVASRDGEMVGHASVVTRELHVAARPLRTGYVEAVATRPDRQRQGIGTYVMRAVGAYIARRFELGALGTGSHAFYVRLGWRTWRGPSSVRTRAGERRTPAEDGYIMVLRTPLTPPLDPDAPISCEWRPGDAW